jgi:hypothetical protein
MTDTLGQFRSFVNEILERDGHDLEAVKSSFKPNLGAAVEAVPGAPEHSESAVLEAIVSLHRPVFAIVDDKVDPTFTSNMGDEESSAMTQLVKDNAAAINGIIPSIGRIDLPGDENNPWVGTGWVIDSELGNDIVITNAHVAQLFAERSASGFGFRPLPFLESPEAPIVDFRRELAETPPRRFKVLDVIHIGTPGLLDVAFLRVARSGDGPLSGPLKLAKSDPPPNLPVATIGYPGTDRGSYDLATLLRVYGNVFNTKRCAPGKIMGLDSRGISHDCSTMPGSSGSDLFDLVTGEAVGLHFQGVPFKSNHAVPVSVIRKLIKDQPWRSAGRTNVITAPPGGSIPKSPKGDYLPANSTREGPVNLPTGGIEMTVADSSGVRIVLPLEITVRIGEPQPAAGTVSAGSAAVHTTGVTQGTPEAAVAAVRQQILTHPNVVAVRASYLFKDDGRLSDQKGVVIKVRPEASRDPKDYGLEPSISGVPISIEMADLESLAGKLAPEASMTLEAPAEMQAYERDLSDPKFNLDPITDDMTLTLHVSPEAGWRVLSKFFDGGDYDRITIGMYNFTAPHIIDAVRSAIKPNDHEMTLTLDRKSDDIGGGNKKDDWPEEKVVNTLKRDGGRRFQWTPASVSGPGRLFATSYHIKVVVLGSSGSGGRIRDNRFWLSSGNWASSNQPPFDDDDHPIEGLTWADVKTFDRDWHAVVVNAKLAKVFRNHLEQDFKDCEALAGQEAAAPMPPDLIVPEDYFLEAPRTTKKFKAFKPKVISKRLKVQPVLTPDNYPDVVVPLIKGATKSVLFINQSFDIKENEDDIPEHYRRLLDALLDRQKNISDVRIIFRSGFGKERDTFRRAVEFGFDKDRIRFFGTCHTKGIIVDNKRVLLGSQNWTGAGTKPNRDASLLIENEEAAQYFADIFEFDWENLATDRVAPDHGPTRRARAAASDEEAVIPSGFRVVPWGTWNGT